MGEIRGSISFFGTYRPPVPLGIFSCPADPPPSSYLDEVSLTDDEFYNQNGHPIPAGALKEILAFLGKKNPASDCGVTLEDVDEGRVTGLVFVSERDRGLETLHLALRRPATGQVVKVLSLLGDIYGVEGGVRMEDSGCIAGGFTVPGRRGTVGHSLVYVSTREPVEERRTPWTVVYRTDLADGLTERLTPEGQYDLSPAVSPSGKMVAVANFQGSRWTGEIENLKTNIVIMNVDKKAQGIPGRKRLINDAGWPTWGSDNVIFFHRGFDENPPTNTAKWAVFRYDIAAGKEERVTPVGMDAMTPAAISETRVAVAFIGQKSLQVQKMVKRVESQYRHIQIFDTATPEKPPVKITQMMRKLGDHYNPFVLDGGRRIGYHRCRTDNLLPITLKSNKKITSIVRKFDKVQSHHPDVGLFRVTGVFPTISRNGKKLAFVDNEFKNVWLADSKGLRIVYKASNRTSFFGTSWNQDDKHDSLYVCKGPAFTIEKTVEILRLRNVSTTHWTDQVPVTLIEGKYNCAFPSTNAEGTKLVFRSSRDRLKGGEREHKNLFVMDALIGETAGLFQLTDGKSTDTHCSWSPKVGCDWVVFSSYRDKPAGQPALDHGLDPGFFAVYLVSAKDISMLEVKNGELPQPVKVPVPVRVIYSSPTIAGHINHPVFSPDMMSIVFAADLAAVSADPISMPHFTHSVRPYGDIFSVNLLDTEDDMAKNEDIKEFHRVTHSRYEYSTPTWSRRAEDDGDQLDPNTKWKMLDIWHDDFEPKCPYVNGQANQKESWQMTGHLSIDKRCC